ncbi:MAG: GIY-YIG nuclease family protein [Terriglobales bacterium]
MPRKEFTYYIYIMSSKSGTLYIGVTNSVYRRALDHKSGVHAGFTQKYGCNRLVYFEVFHRVGVAIDREKGLKGWSRAKKMALIESMNPKWLDLAEGWGEMQEAPSWGVREVEGLRPRKASSRQRHLGDSSRPKTGRSE